MICKKCGVENPETSDFCGKCGASLKEPVSNGEDAEAFLSQELQSGPHFFKNCSRSLRRFSVILFVINLFITSIAAIVAAVAVYTTYGSQALLILVGPIITGIVILVLIARFISALVFGFAEVVENSESANSRKKS